MKISQEVVKELFDYHEDGYLLRKQSKQGVLKDMTAGKTVPKGKHPYKQICINNSRYDIHRIIFLWHHGFMPIQVDHEDMDKTNNKIKNLRQATQSQNQHNKPMQKNNSTGFKGVCYDKRNKKFKSSISVCGKPLSLGYYKTPEEAHEAYKQAAIKHFGEFARYQLKL